MELSNNVYGVQRIYFNFLKEFRVWSLPGTNLTLFSCWLEIVVGSTPALSCCSCSFFTSVAALAALAAPTSYFGSCRQGPQLWRWYRPSLAIFICRFFAFITLPRVSDLKLGEARFALAFEVLLLCCPRVTKATLSFGYPFGLPPSQMWLPISELSVVPFQLEFSFQLPFTAPPYALLKTKNSTTFNPYSLDRE